MRRPPIGWLCVFLLQTTLAVGGKYLYTPPPVDIWAACDTSHRCALAEDAVYDPDAWEEVADTTADGAAYLAMKVGTFDYQAQIAVGEIDTTCDYLWLRAKGSGVIWLQKTPFGPVPSNTTTSVLFNGDTATDWTWTAIGQRTDEDLTRIPAGASKPINDVAQRDFDFVAGDDLYVLAQPSVLMDSWYCSTNANASPVSPSGGSGTTVDYSLYEVTTEPTVDDAQWDRASIMAKTGYSSTPPSADMRITAVWKNGSPDRLCLRGEETLANLEWTSTAEDGAVTAETRVQAYLKGDSLNRVKDANLWTIQVNPQPAKTDANHPSGAYTVASDLATVNATASVSGNRRRMQVCFDSPFAIATNTQWLCDFAQWEKVTSVPVRRKSAFTTLSDVTDPAGFGVCAAGGALPGASDSTPPAVGTASVSNVTGSSLTVTATASDAESGISSCNVVYKTPATGTPTFGTDPSVVGTMAGGSCQATVSGLSGGVAYRGAVYAVNGAALSTTGASVDQTTTSTAERFVCASGGSNGAAGTSAGACWADLTFATDKARLLPGYTLTLVNGTYTGDTQRIRANCATSGGNANNGTASQRITIRAQNERQAWLKGDGLSSRIKLDNCSYWTIAGLRISARDASGSDALGVVRLNSSHQLLFTRNLLHHANRLPGSEALLMNGGLSTQASNNNTFLENEMYYCAAYCFISKYGTGNIYRRNYVNNRGYPNLSAGTNNNVGSCFQNYPGSNNLYENNICEQKMAGGASAYSVAPIDDSINNRFLGNIALSTNLGARSNFKAASGLNGNNKGTYFRDFLGIGNQYGVRTIANTDFTCEQCTVINAGVNAFTHEVHPSAEPAFVMSIALINTLVHGGVTGKAYSITDQEAWSVDYPATMGVTTGTPFTPAQTDANIQFEVNSASLPMGSCRVYVPSSAGLLKSAGSGNEDIGATILFAYVNGALTTTKLWQVGHASPGKWLGGLGATVSGTNPPFSSTLQVTNADLNTVSDGATDVHSRLNIMADSCLPVGY